LLRPAIVRAQHCCAPPSYGRSTAAPRHRTGAALLRPAIVRAQHCCAPTPNNASFRALLHTSLRLSANCHLRGILQSAFRSGTISGFVAIDVIGVHPQNRRAPIAIRLE
jgi:hypothetical protein